MQMPGTDYRKLRVKAMECVGLIGPSFLQDSHGTCGLTTNAIAMDVGQMRLTRSIKALSLIKGVYLTPRLSG